MQRIRTATLQSIIKLGLKARQDYFQVCLGSGWGSCSVWLPSDNEQRPSLSSSITNPAMINHALQAARKEAKGLLTATLDKQKSGQLFKANQQLDDLIINTAMNQVNYVSVRLQTTLWELLLEARSMSLRA